MVSVMGSYMSTVFGGTGNIVSDNFRKLTPCPEMEYRIMLQENILDTYINENFQSEKARMKSKLSICSTFTSCKEL